MREKYTRACWAICLILLWTLPVLATPIRPGAEQPAVYLPLFQGKRLGLVVNASSRVGSQHLVDFLRAQGQHVELIFAPEHGFRGTADAGAYIQDGRDPQTGLPVVSLYGKNKRPSPQTLANVDLLIFDIQDVGVRFYTYISTLHYVMEAAAEAGKPLVVLDRPNPNGAYIDGPVLVPSVRSFVGLHPIPLVHGLTVAELAQMIVGEGWLRSEPGAQPLDLTVVPMQHYRHDLFYELPIKPSPNLPNAQAVRLYPSLGLFEGTRISVGRGTNTPFQVIGYPLPVMGLSSFLPVSRPGAQSPPYQGETCYGLDLRRAQPQGLSLHYLIQMYRQYPGHDFFNSFFEKLAGTPELQTQIEAGWSEAQIRETWAADLTAYRKMRANYVLYP